MPTKKSDFFAIIFLVSPFFSPTLYTLHPKTSPFTPQTHAFHTSVTRMDYNAQTKTFEVSLRVFTDDLETTLAKNNSGRKFLVVNGDANDSFVEKYVRKHFALLNAQKQKKPYSYLGKEQEVDATWIYLEIPCREPIAGFSVQQAVLFDAFDDQVNLLNLKYLTQKRSYIFKDDQKIQRLEI